MLSSRKWYKNEVESRKKWHRIENLLLSGWSYCRKDGKKITRIKRRWRRFTTYRLRCARKKRADWNTCAPLYARLTINFFLLRHRCCLGIIRLSFVHFSANIYQVPSHSTMKDDYFVLTSYKVFFLSNIYLLSALSVQLWIQLKRCNTI